MATYLPILDTAKKEYRLLAASMKEDRLWGAAYFCVLLLPLMLIFQRALADVFFSLAGILFLLHSAKTHQWQWVKDPFVCVGLAAWAWLMFGASPFAVNPSEALGVAVPWVRYLLFYAACVHWILKDSLAIYVVGTSVAALLVLVAIDTYWQAAFGISLTGHKASDVGRLTGPMSNVKVGIYVAKILLPTMGICLFLALKTARGVWLAVGLLIAFEMMVLLSGERTAFGSSMLGIMLIVGLVGLSDPHVRKISLSLGAVFAAAVIILAVFNDTISRRLAWLMINLSNFWASSYGQLFSAAFVIGKAHWIAGVGPKGFRVLCQSLLDKGTIDYCDLHPHNTYLEWLSETGVVGLLLYISMIITLIAIAWRYFKNTKGIDRLLPAVAMATLMVHFFPLMVTQSMFSNWPGILLWYSLAVAFSSLNLLRSIKTGASSVESVI